MDIIQLLKQYRKEKKKWKEAGKPMRSKERMQEIHSICAACPSFNPGGGMLSGYDQCGDCQCNLHPEEEKFNKLSWSTTHCSLDEPKWDADYPVSAPERATGSLK